MSGAFPEDTSAFDAWAKAHLEGWRGPSAVKKFPTGQSNPTYLIDAASGRYVLRRKPPGKLLKSAHLIEREFRVLKALEGVGYPAPRALALCEDEGVIGTAFYLMTFVDGRVLWNPALPELERQDRRPIYDAMNEGLARLHLIDVAAAGLSDYGKPGSYFVRQYQRWTDQYRSSETARMEDMERLIAWLADKVPADDGRVALVHGDWRIDNMIFDAYSPRLLAVLDWELSTLGHPFADLAYQCMQWRLPAGKVSRIGRRRPGGERHPDRSRICRRLLRANGAQEHSRLDLPHRLQLLPQHRDPPGRLQALTRRQRVESGARPAIGRVGAAGGPYRLGVGRGRELGHVRRPAPPRVAVLPVMIAHAKRRADPAASVRASLPALERWQSGRSRRTRNAEYAQAYRGFESLPLRHDLSD